MTGLPAQRYGFQGRGRIAVNYYADVCVFDANVVAEGGTFATPKVCEVLTANSFGFGARFVSYIDFFIIQVPAKGIQWVLCNGKVVYDGEQRVTSARPGCLLRRETTSS